MDFEIKRSRFMGKKIEFIQIFQVKILILRRVKSPKLLVFSDFIGS